MSYLLLISLVPKPGTILTPIIIGREIVFDFQNQILLKEETPTLKEAQAKTPSQRMLLPVVCLL